MPGSTRVIPDLRQLDDRRHFLLGIRPIVRAMETGKQKDAEETKHRTRCVARKDGNKGGGGGMGGYSFYDMDTGHRISPDEYQHRYATMICASRQKRRRRGMQTHRYDGGGGNGGLASSRWRQLGLCGRSGLEGRWMGRW